MKTTDFLKLYKNNSLVLGVADAIKPNHLVRLKLKGLVGSLDAVIAAAVYGLNHQNHLFILHDKEEAAYFFNDLQNQGTKKYQEGQAYYRIKHRLRMLLLYFEAEQRHAAVIGCANKTEKLTG